MKKLVIFLICLLPVIVVADKNNIIAVVNDSPITKYEFDERKKLVIAMFNVDVTQPGIEARLNEDIMRSLIESEVLHQHAARVGGVIGDEEIEGTIIALEKQNNMPRGGMLKFLKNKNVNLETFRKQIAGEKIKMNIINSISGNISISEEEVNSALIDALNKDFEIEAWVFSSRNADEASYKKMKQMKPRLKSCDKLEAKLYDQFADAEKFDRNLKKIDEKIASIIRDTKVGGVSTVFKDAEKFKLVFVCKKTPINVSTEESGKVKYYLLNKKTNLKAEKFLSDLRQKAYVKVMDSNLAQ